MIDIIKYPSERAERKLSEIVGRRPGADPELEARVLEIIRAVKSEGDTAVLRYVRRFDAPGLEEGKLRVSDEERAAASLRGGFGFHVHYPDGYPQHRRVSQTAIAVFAFHGRA